jgi:hypothetical protein
MQEFQGVNAVGWARHRRVRHHSQAQGADGQTQRAVTESHKTIVVRTLDERHPNGGEPIRIGCLWLARAISRDMRNKVVRSLPFS